MRAVHLKERMARRIRDEQAKWKDKLSEGSATDYPAYREMVGRIKSLDSALVFLDEEMKSTEGDTDG